MSNISKNNPFANPDGSPKKGHEEAYFNFEKNLLPENRNEIPRSEGEIIVDEEKSIGEQMDSDPEAK
ncbi:MAG: hypothetical protein ABI415_01810 [Flavitalea sp.]